MNDINLTFKENIEPILMGAKTAQDYYKKTSISALARDLILQYPVLISADVAYDDAIVLAKALELQYASLQVMVLSADTAFGVDPTSTAGVRDLLARYHSNNDTPNLVSYAGNMIYNVGSVIQSFESVDAEEISLTKVKTLEFTHPDEFLESLWERPISANESTTLNDLYNPSKALIDTVTRAVESVELSAATEVKNGPKPNPTPNTPNTPQPKPKPNFLDVANKINNPALQFNVRAISPGSPDDSRYKKDLDLSPQNAKMYKLERDYSKLEPTMLELEFFVKNGDQSGLRRAVIGISTMPRAIPSDAMRANVIKALQHDNTGFKFIAWTRGEQKLVKDFLFSVSRIKEDAMAKSKYDKWFAALRKRKRNAKAFKGSRNAINPLTTIILTKNDVALIKQSSGFDLLDEETATKLMDSLYLLCFMVVDTDTGIVSTLLDGQRYFTETTVNHLKKSNKDKGNDLTNVREMLKLLGR